ncbi:cytochrome b/b6 domain-containing protein [Shewanella nanhaiensis]|uniref:Cytochrome b/b6 domain-containing protein n=1 Tax=Shewanella nanhaiensis TaxID=2864872 RepID=A0ABS7E475_9GAMM|nr:cytochrome b/b6 domain-containing protein [Shewanella nanhaiensis]MBW8184473.1 cytochrome b/b6 domain-containing protein [Shewanella nanhaiensis]
MNNKIKVWDLPTRIFHWGMIVLLGGLWWTADAGEMDWHQVLAYSLMVFIVFRLIWGVVGSDTSRFSHFIKHPKAVLDYMKLTKEHGVSSSIGHNPLGGYMVIALIMLVSAQLTTGLFATDEIFTEGPLYSLVSSETGSLMSWLHKKIFYVMLGFASIHVLAVAYHRLKGDKLITPMITGYKQVSEASGLELKFTSVLVALLLVALLAGLVGNYLIKPVVGML